MGHEPRIPCSDKLELARTAQTAGVGGKAALRLALAKLRNTLDPVQKAHWDALICTRVLHWWDACAKHVTLGVYWPLRGEVDLAPAYAELAAQGVALALPVVLARDAALGFAEWVPGEAMVVGVAYACLESAFAADTHDIALNAILTELD